MVSTPRPSAQDGPVQRFVERFLWRSRLLVLVAVFCSLVVAAIALVLATADVVRFALKAFAAVAEIGAEQSAADRLGLVAHVVKIIDLYLVATFMIVFPLGLYELFIGKIEEAEQSIVAQRLLLIRDLEDLKERLFKIVLLILAMVYLEFAIKLTPTTYLDLLALAAGSCLVAGSLFLSRKKAAPGGA